MREVIIKSKIVGREGAIGGGKPIAFPDLSAYALRSDFLRLESSFNDFLEGDDTDNVINRWKELEAFLNNISEDYNLLAMLNGKADKATTLSGYGITDAYTKTNVDDLLKSYVTLGGAQTITGEKNFTGGLKVNGSPIYYDTEKKYWKFEGDLLVTGGVTMYGSDSSFTPSTIMDAIAVDGTTISKSGGVLKVIGGTGGGVADSVAWANITGKPTWIGSSKPTYSYSEITGAISTTELQNYLTSNSYLNVTSGDNRYLKSSGGTINGENGQVPLVISNTASTLRIGFVRNNEVLGYLGFIEANKPLFYDTDGNGRLLLHERNYSSYALPLTGGRIVGKLQIQRTPSNISFYNADNVLWGHIGFNAANNAVVWDRSGANEYEILHRGNYSSYALPLSGGTLDGMLTLRASNSSSDSWIEFSNKSNSVVHKLGVRRPESTYGLQYYNGSEYYNVLHEGNYSSYALPLSGGTITSASPVSVTLNANNDGQTALFLQSKGTNKTYVGWDINRGTCLYDFSSDSHFGILNGTPRFNSNTIWHSGNDGDGSGLEADTIGTYKKDSGEKTIIYGTRSDNSNIRRIYDNGWNLMCQNGSDNGAIATLNSNVASATKLQTARTIWGQSFDGTGNVDGKILLTSWDNDGVGLRFHNNTKRVAYISMYAADGNAYLFGQNGNRFLLNHNVYGDIFNVVGGSVGIGTTNPQDKLDVAGNIRTNGGLQFTRIGSGTYNRFTINSNTTYGVEIEAPRATDSADGTALPIFIGWRGGALGIKITSGGNLLANGGITMYSDKRKKTILNHVELSLKQIADAPLIEHYYNSDESKTTHVGSIAQYWANMNDWFCKSDSEGYYTMEIQNAALASAISIARELDRYETKTDKDIKKLKKRICELEEEIERFKIA